MRHLPLELLTSRARFTKVNLLKLSSLELKAFCLLFNTTKSGTKEAVIERLLGVYKLRVILSGFDDVEILKNTYKKKVLLEFCRTAKVWRGGNKHSCAVVLINWRNSSRSKASRLIKVINKAAESKPLQLSFKLQNQGG